MEGINWRCTNRAVLEFLFCFVFLLWRPGGKGRGYEPVSAQVPKFNPVAHCGRQKKIVRFGGVRHGRRTLGTKDEFIR